jgi:hypothetical protein
VRREKTLRHDKPNGKEKAGMTAADKGGEDRDSKVKAAEKGRKNTIMKSS